MCKVIGSRILIFYTNSRAFRSPAVTFCAEKELRANFLVRQPRKKIKELVPDAVICENGSRHQYKEYINQILDYVDVHFADPDLSLKWIAGNVLYMNVDYLSREFLRQTGQKFTDYLTNLRIAKAKVLLKSAQNEKVYTIADQVGFSNNPQYFIQLFKNATGMTPKAWTKNIP